ncbi:NUDIX hydrolase [uncultured Friedmanniella sp.]|uniref:NUDIX hydrolase n=1 Tax=uncultured Friedmanniella sp. TaxID=335381 RepID=UPI0035CA4741
MTVEIALAALVRNGTLLLGHRHPARRWYPDCWDLIGGHVEIGESPEQAVRRECREEVAVDVVRMHRLDLDLSDPVLVPHAFLVTAWAGQPTNAAPDEHDDLGWFPAEALPGLRLSHPAYHRWLPTLLAAGKPPAFR